MCNFDVLSTDCNGKISMSLNGFSFFYFLLLGQSYPKLSDTLPLLFKIVKTLCRLFWMVSLPAILLKTVLFLCATRFTFQQLLYKEKINIKKKTLIMQGFYIANNTNIYNLNKHQIQNLVTANFKIFKNFRRWDRN